jgi:hypothetical protein
LRLLPKKNETEQPLAKRRVEPRDVVDEIEVPEP